MSVDIQTLDPLFCKKHMWIAMIKVDNTLQHDLRSMDAQEAW